MTTYRSRIDGWLGGLIVVAIGVCIHAGVRAVVVGPPVEWWVLALMATLGVALPMWVVLGTRYRLTGTELLIRSGPFTWRVPIGAITDIRATTNPLASPALSLDRLRIDYGHGSSVMISPRHKEQFLLELERLRRTTGAAPRVDARAG